MKLWPVLRDTSFLFDLLEDEALVKRWVKMLDTAHSGKPTSPAAGATDYWDYQWNFAIWSQSGLSIFPNAILVSNVGYRHDGTHTKRPDRWAGLPAIPMEFPLRHPLYVIRNREADDFVIEQDRQATHRSWPYSKRVVRRIVQAMSGIRNRVLYTRTIS